MLDENKSKSLCPWVSNAFLDKTSKAQATIEKKPSKFNFIKIKNVCTANDTIKKVKI